MRRILLFAFASALVACGNRSSAVDTSDAAAPLPVNRPALAPGYMESMRADIARHGTEIVRGDGRIETRGEMFVASFDDPKTADLRLPAYANAPFVLEKGTMRLRAKMLGTTDAKGHVDGDAVVYPNALAHATLFHVPTTRGTEE